MKVSKTCFALAALLSASGAWAHGYVSEPASRGYLCTNDQGNQNKDCGAVQYEPQSVEGGDGFPAYKTESSGGSIVNAPKDGEIAGAGLATMSPLNAQSDSRWHKHAMSAGKYSFAWTFTAPHRTKDWRYYITKPNWNPNKPLSRASFETTPFCVIDGKNQIPALGKSQPHECNVPAREGYQVILATWDVGDTDATFYNVIDVDFGGHNHPGDNDHEDNVTPPDDGNNGGNDNVTPPDDGNNGGNDNVTPPDHDDGNKPPSGDYPEWKLGHKYHGGEVVHGRDGNLYKCKSAHGANGWCGASPVYEPGAGWAWAQAWDIK